MSKSVGPFEVHRLSYLYVKIHILVYEYTRICAKIFYDFLTLLPAGKRVNTEDDIIEPNDVFLEAHAQEAGLCNQKC